MLYRYYICHILYNIDYILNQQQTVLLNFRGRVQLFVNELTRLKITSDRGKPMALLF